MIDIRKLKELVRLMVENDLSELDLQDQEETVTIKRGVSGVPIVMPSAATGAPMLARPAASTETGTDSGLPADTEGLLAVESPMVGTYYASANPDSPPFAEVGKRVTPDTTVCLIEAMKVFNEIKAEVAGVIEQILIDNGQPVEFGQKLFLIRPA